MYMTTNDRFAMTRTATLLMLVFLVGCRRDTSKIDLVAPFDDGRVLAEVRATWSPGAEKRTFAGGRRLKETEQRFQYKVDVRNRQSDKLLVRLDTFALIDKAGLEIGRDETRVECVLSADGADALLSGEVWLPERAAKDVHGFAVGHSAVPLDDKGRAFYRDWLLKGRPGATAEVDAEIARDAAAPACPRR